MKKINFKKIGNIILNSWSILALRKNLKIKTRRPVQRLFPDGQFLSDKFGNLCAYRKNDKCDWVEFKAAIKPPLGKIGNFLYVKEKYAIVPKCKLKRKEVYWRGKKVPLKNVLAWKGISKNYPHKKLIEDQNFVVIYAADNELFNYKLKWKKPFNMPFKYSRLLLKIKDIKIERFNDISYLDILEEGCPPMFRISEEDARAWYNYIWDRCNKNKLFKSAKNPWVWTTTFSIYDENYDPWSF